MKIVHEIANSVVSGPENLVVKAILGEGNGGLSEDELVFLTGLGRLEVVGALDRLGGRVAEVESGVWMVVK